MKTIEDRQPRASTIQGSLYLSRSILLLCCMVFFLVGKATSMETDWKDIPGRARKTIESVIPASDHIMSVNEAKEFVTGRGTRGSTYDLVGLLLRGTENDLKNGQVLLQEILSRQITDESNPRIGIWHPGQEGRPLDANWREFVGLGMILIREGFLDRIPKKLHDPLSESIRYAALGSAQRKVSPEYTNIALMSAFLMAYAGKEFKDRNLLTEGMAKGEAIWEEFDRHGTFTEYNSPTYYGVNIMALAFWRELGPKADMRRWGADMEARLWRDIGAFYHAGLKNMAGPYSRGYGMDMSEYVSLLGLWIDLVLDDSRLSPNPKSENARSSFERYYLPLFVIVPTVVPDDALSNLRDFSGPRRMERTVFKKSGDHQITAVMESEWMMGAATGLKRRWEQHCPATLHWQAGDDKVGWLLLTGESGVDAVVARKALEIVLPDRAQSYSLTFHVSVPGLAPEQVGEENWDFPCMPLRVTSQLGQGEVQWVDSKRMGQVLQIRWDIQKGDTSSDRVLVIQP